MNIVAEALLTSPEIQPQYRKLVPKYCKIYLLDRFELNMKSRCVFAWTGANIWMYVSQVIVLFNADPKFDAFKPVDDKTFLAIEDLLKGSRLYFTEAEDFSSKFVKDFTADRRIYYANNKEFRETMNIGLAYTLATILADWWISIL